MRAVNSIEEAARTKKRDLQKHQASTQDAKLVDGEVEGGDDGGGEIGGENEEARSPKAPIKYARRETRRW